MKVQFDFRFYQIIIKNKNNNFCKKIYVAQWLGTLKKYLNFKSHQPKKQEPFHLEPKLLGSGKVTFRQTTPTYLIDFLFKDEWLLKSGGKIDGIVRNLF